MKLMNSTRKLKKTSDYKITKALHAFKVIGMRAMQN